MAPPTQAHRLYDLLRDFRAGMLVTQAADGSFHGRPMALARIDEQGALWFATDRQSGKVDEIRADEQVNVSCQGSGKYVSLSGVARLVDDRRKVDEVWNEEMRVWFPGGKQDPRLILLRVDPAQGEFWDNSGTNAVKYLFKAGVAYLRGERPTDDETEHGRVALGRNV